uniref:Isomerase n=1 Tax=Pseudoalteromonas sp. DS-12 TaxID=375285 RepID=Q1KML1_9GAMM|nr:unknown [Pseudoalteromonas sp. DS-12]
MRTAKFQQVDVFADKLAQGNPALVVILNHWLSDEMQAISQVNLPEAFILRSMKYGWDYHIRWFTPVGEIKLCGHATLAAGNALFHQNKYHQKEVIFHSSHGKITKDDQTLRCVFPSWGYEPHAFICPAIEGFLNKAAFEVLTKRGDLMVDLEHEDVSCYQPDFNALAHIDKYRGVIVTAQTTDAGTNYLRCFAPGGISEDPATGSAHCVIAPYWFEKLGKNKLTAIQGLENKGEFCVARGNEVLIYGHAQYLRGVIP